MTMSFARLAHATLSQLCTLVTDGTHDTPKRVEKGFPLIKAKEIVGGRIDFETCDQISRADHLQVIARSKPEKGDTLFAHIGASLGEAAYVNTEQPFSIKNIALFKPDPSKVNCRYLYFLVISPEFQAIAKAARTGSAQPFLSLGHLRAHPIRYHEDMREQERIAAILTVYEDLIELNRRRIALLEEMAQRLFDEWFVRFRFPGYENVQFKSHVPDGWANVTVRELGRVVTGKTPSKSNSAFFGGSIPFIKIPDMHDGSFVLSTGDHLSSAGANLQEGKMIPPGSLCVSCIGTIGLVVITTEQSQTNQQINSVILNREHLREFLFFSFKAAKAALRNLGSNGATMGNVNKEKFETLRLLVPAGDLIRRFHELVSPKFDAVLNYSRANKALVASRELLLPRLMSGELSVTLAERVLEAVA